MAGWAVGQTDRFAAAAAMSVVSDYVSFHLTSEVCWYDHAILEGAWHDASSQYADRSPVTHAHRCTTPTLILQGPTIAAPRSAKLRSCSSRSQRPARRSSSWSIRVRVTFHWSGHTRWTRSHGPKPGSTRICKKPNAAMVVYRSHLTASAAASTVG